MERTAAEIAQLIGARVEGDPGAKVNGIAAPENAAPGDLIYLDAAKYLESAALSHARCVVCSAEANGHPSLAGKTRIVAAQPKLAFAKAAAWLRPHPAIARGVHPTAVIASSARLAYNVAVGPYAVIEDGVEVGEATEIGAFCFLGAGARIGSHCRLHPRVTLYHGTRLGHRVVLHSGAVIGSDGFGYVFGEGKHWPFPQIGGMEIADDVEIGANTTVDRGSLGVTRIEAGVKIDNLVQIGHNVRVGAHTVMAAQVGISGSTIIGRNVTFAGQSGAADHVEIGDGATLGARAAVLTNKKVPAGQLVWGLPARSHEKMQEQQAWLSRLPDLGRRLRSLEARLAALLAEFAADRKAPRQS
jgi:UDP-3-O-[3-hydroxymyristoyl] glucosamine N-acyltransferase